LSRILRPTRGRVEMRGRVGSLLEVGAGFHPELTGRENIFLNGAILGLTQAGIARCFDEIVAFAGVEQHLDEPVKHYSSGMYMRLAFSVAAHVDPEILLIDEVLAVGDADFQKRTEERLERGGRGGQTVLLVSHNLQTVLRLCQRVVCLEQGRVAAVGRAAEVASRYLDMGGAKQGQRRYDETPFAPGDSIVRLGGVRVCGRDGATCTSVDIGEGCGIEIEYEVLHDAPVLLPSLVLHNERGAFLWATDAGNEWHGRARSAGRYREVAWIPPHLLGSGLMRVTVAIESLQPSRVHFREPDAVAFHAVETRDGARGRYTGFIEGGVRPKLAWTVTRE
jgi:lipopolysaccharide transport system ATP-binding protein